MSLLSDRVLHFSRLCDLPLIELFSFSSFFEALFNLFFFFSQYLLGALFLFSNLFSHLLFLPFLFFDLLEELVKLELLLGVLVVAFLDDALLLYDLFLEGVDLLYGDQLDESLGCCDCFCCHFEPLGI